MRRLTTVLVVLAVTGCLVVSSLLRPTATILGATAVWEKTVLDAGRIRTVLVYPTEHTTVFAGTDTGLFRSTDLGVTWEPYGAGIKTSSSGTVKVLSLAAAKDGSRFYAGTSAGVFQSTDAGQTWVQGSGMLSGSGVLRYYYAIAALAVDPASPQTVYAGDSGMMTKGGVLKSTDGGASWVSMGSGITGDDVDALAITPGKPSTVYAAVEDALYASSDAGATWAKTTGTMNVGSSVPDILTVVTTVDTVYAGTTSGVWRSTDGGATWSQGSGLGSTGILRYFYAIAALVVDPADASILYAGDSGLMTSGGVSSSTDGGVSWSRIGGALTENVSAIAVSPSNPSVVYAATGVGLFRLTSVVPSRFQIAASVPQGHGAVEPAMSEVMEGDSLTLNLSADAGYHLTLLTDNGSTVTDLVRNNKYQLTSITADHAIVAAFGPIPIILPPASSHTLVLTIGSQVMSVDDVGTLLDSPPIIRDGRTLLPIRAVIEALEGSVSWDPVNRKATVTLGTHTVEVWIGSREARVDGVTVALDVAAMIVNSRTLLPLRFVTENLGCTVTWDPIGRTVTIEL